MIDRHRMNRASIVLRLPCLFPLYSGYWIVMYFVSSPYVIAGAKIVDKEFLRTGTQFLQENGSDAAFVADRAELLLKQAARFNLKTRSQCLQYLGSHFRAVLGSPPRKTDFQVHFSLVTPEPRRSPITACYQAESSPIAHGLWLSSGRLKNREGRGLQTLGFNIRNCEFFCEEGCAGPST
jgi:hypothetical protein